MIRLLRNSFVERFVKSNIFFLYLSDLIIQKCVWLLPYEDDWLYFKKHKINNRSIIVDIGAHWGESALTFSKFYPRNKIISFEPNKYIFKKLKSNTKHLNINMFNFGITSKGNKESKLYFPYYKNKQLSLWGSQNLKNLKNRLKKYTYLNPKNVKFKLLKCEFREFPKIKAKISIIKIDVEGAEFEVLKSLDKIIILNKPLIFIEYNENNFKSSFSFLKKKNYKAFCFHNSKLVMIKNNNEMKKVLSLKKKRTVNIIFKYD